MDSNDALIDTLKRDGVLYDEEVEAAMGRVDRIAFVPKIYRSAAYRDIPLPIHFDQTISAPHMVAIMTQNLTIQQGNKILEIGAGSGYQAAVLAEMVGAEGEVFTIERIPDLAHEAVLKLQAYSNVHVVIGNGSLGLKKEAPFDRILVACAARRVPKALAQQLAEGGRMIIPLGHGAAQRLTLVEKIGGVLNNIDLGCSCRFVPLID